MPIFKKLLPLTLLILAGCKNPPLIDSCLLKIQTRSVTLQDGSLLKTIDLTASKAFCTPVNTKKAPYQLSIDQLNKYYALSNQDNAILQQWIVNNVQ